MFHGYAAGKKAAVRMVKHSHETILREMLFIVSKRGLSQSFKAKFRTGHEYVFQCLTQLRSSKSYRSQRHAGNNFSSRGTISE
jgi:hypothetical protein